MRKLLKWFDDNLISLLAGFLLVFIPLYPKIPLADILPGYIVRVRMEDFFIGITVILWIIWLVRKKLTLGSNPLLKIISVYLLIGFISMLSAIFITHTVPLQPLHIGKVLLHLLRRVEYFSLFFVFYSTIKTMRQVKIYILLLIFTMVAVTVYGYGQKYFYFPAFSTMNREFSKGWMLYLSEHARVLSTFGGHYDLAAFTMMLLVILWSVFFGLKKLWKRITVLVIIAGAFWLLILTVSRTSFIAYLLGIAVLCFLWAFKRGLRWSVKAWVAVTVLSIVVMIMFGDLSERFTKLLKINERFSGVKNVLLNPFGKPPSERAIFLENNIAAVTSKSDQPPSPQRPVDVEKDIPLIIPDATQSGSFSAISRTYSQNALVYDLSTGIRLDALWPKAINGLLKNPFVGSGYSTLTKVNAEDFTEAESTDNDFLRSLGETGVLGFLAFYAIVLSIVVIVWRTFIRIHDVLFFSYVVGLIGAIFGLLLNALYIDVFEASKVAYVFWAMTGIALGGVNVLKLHTADHKGFPKNLGVRDFFQDISNMVKGFFKKDIFFILIILGIALYVRFYRIDTPLADWHSWRQADTASVTRQYVRNGLNLLYPTYQDLSSIPSGKDNPKGYRFVEFPLYNALGLIVDKLTVGWNLVSSQRFTTILISLISILFLYKLVKRHDGRLVAFVSASVFALLPYSIFYSRVILPEPLLVMCTLGTLNFFDVWVRSNKKRYWVLAVLFASLAMLVKPFAIFAGPAIIYMFYLKNGFAWLKKPSTYIFILLTLIPFVLWRSWISHFPEGIPASDWLFNGDGIRLKGAFFYWIFADRIGRLILGYWGLVPFVLGIILKPKKGGYLFYFYGVGMILYLIVVATGNVRHDYYQIPLVPVIAYFFAKGFIGIFNLPKELFSRKIAILFVFISTIFAGAFSWYFIKDYYNINHQEIVDAGHDVSQMTNSKALIIAPYSGDTAFLFQTERSGWPIMQGSIDDMIKKGAHYYVSVNFDDTTKDILKQTTTYSPYGKFTLIKQTPSYVIIQIVPSKELPKD